MDKWEVHSHATTNFISAPQPRSVHLMYKVSLRSYYCSTLFSNPKQLRREFQFLLNLVHEEWEKVSVPNVFPVHVMLNCPESEEIAHKSCRPKHDRKCTVVANHGRSPSCYCKTASTDVTASICSTLNSILRKSDQVSIFYSICTQRMRGGNRAFLTVNQQQPCSKAVCKWAAAAAAAVFKGILLAASPMNSWCLVRSNLVKVIVQEAILGDLSI